jgi:predicted amidohydrolase YtcJ
VQAAVTRRGADGRVSGPEEAMALHDALASYTSVPAWQDHAEAFKGRLRPGFAADVCVLDGDVTAVDPDAIAGLSVAATVVDGRVVYERERRAAAEAAGTATAGQAHAERGCCCERSGEIRAGRV